MSLIDLEQVHHTPNSAIGVFSWERLENYEFTSPALVDNSIAHNGKPLLARIDFTQVLDYAELIGVELASFEELMLLRARAPFQLKPFLGTPRAENALRHSMAHDDYVWRELEKMRWKPGAGAVSGAGKNWRRSRGGVLTPAGKSALVGWDKDGGGPGEANDAQWQEDAVAHNRFHFDDGTTSILVRKIGIISQVLIDPIREVVGTVTDAVKGDSNMEEIGRGDRGQSVRTWQLIAVRFGFAIEPDGIFGKMTEETTRTIQARAGLPVTGRVNAATWAIGKLPEVEGAPPLAPSHNSFVSDYPASRALALVGSFVEAQHYRKVPERTVNKLVLHTMEWAEKNNTAEACAAFFKKPGSRKHIDPATQAATFKPIIASAHLCVDVDSIVQCVPFRHVAFAAPNLNAGGIHIEQAGFARQSDAEWHDPFSSAMLINVAKLLAALSVDFNIPLVHLALDEVRDPHSMGVCTHHDGTRAFKIVGGHTDPGPSYPMAEVLEQARAYV